MLVKNENHGMKNFLKQFTSWVRNLLPRFVKFWSSSWFDPHESFLRLPAFWFPFTLIGIVSFILYLKVVVDQRLFFGLAGDIDDWYKWFQVPIWVAALIIPIVGLFNANHKSEQSKAAMELTKSQNNFANYYKHLEKFVEFLDFTKEIENVDHKSLNARKLHASLFPNARYGVFSLELHKVQKHFELIIGFVNYIVAHSDPQNNLDAFPYSIGRPQGNLDLFIGLNKLFIREFRVQRAYAEDGTFTDVERPAKDLLHEHLNELIVLHKILSFDTAFDPFGQLELHYEYIYMHICEIVQTRRGRIMLGESEEISAQKVERLKNMSTALGHMSSRLQSP